MPLTALQSEFLAIIATNRTPENYVAGGLEDAESFIASCPSSEVGCLCYDPIKKRFVAPEPGNERQLIPHYGCVGGIIPRPSLAHLWTTAVLT